MSCEIKLLANFSALNEIQEYFGLFSDENWLNDVHFSLSPFCDIISFAYGSLFIILTSKWDREKQMNTYKITFKGVFDNPNSQATSVLNIPIIGHGISSHASIDWTCVMIGLDSGYVLFYTDNGNLIHSQQWHNESVTSIKAQSGKHINEEVYVAYPSCVCIVQGSHLFPTLKTMKQQSSTFSVYKNENTQLDTIGFRKWGFGGRGQTTSDSVVAGPQKICSFDHLMTACLEGGFNAKFKSSAPQNCLVISVGSKPYVGFHYAKEGFAQPVLADVARAVASKIKSALPSWFGGSSSQKHSVEPEVQIIAPEPMVCRFGICDQQRNASYIWLAPGNKLAVVADNLGRLVLVDCMKGIALRLWKGYRDAQCGFIEVGEKVHKNNNSNDKRKSMFLIIYAPKRKILEIWSLQNAVKVAAFNASNNGHLIYNTHSYMGVTQNSSKIKYSAAHTCIFFDPDENSVKEFLIPFHCALSDSNSTTAKDLHLLKRLKLFLKSCDGDEERDFSEMTETCQSFETTEIKLQCVEMLVKNKKITPKLFELALKAFIEEEEKESNHLKITCKNYIQMTKLYVFANTINECHEKQEQEDQENIKLSENELITIQKLIDLSTINKKTPSGGNKVKFEKSSKSSNSFVDYISAFNVLNEDLILMKHDSFDSYAHIGEIIYDELIQHGNLNNFVSIVQDIGLIHEDIFKMYLAYWLKQGFEYGSSEELINDTTKFSLILREICILAGDKVKFDNNTVCVWWQNVREFLLESSCALRSFLAAIICRNEALKYEESSDNEDYAFEEVSQEACQWMLIIGKLDDVAVLGGILSDSLICENPKLPCLKYQSPQISLKEILKGGKGIISELVTKWLAASGIDPQKLIVLPNNDEDEKGVFETGEKSTINNLQEVYKNHQLTPKELYKSAPDPKLEPVLYNLNLLRQHFPFSLEAGTLISHMTWEYMCEWSKNLTHFELLQAGMMCLQTIPRLQFALKHGLCCMIWNAHLKIPLEATKKLVNKVGRLPKEKLCLQDIGISDALIPQFLDICIEFLEHFRISIDFDKIELKFEELLQEGPIPLTVIALQQNSANMILLKLHSELSNVLSILTSFNVKHQKPIQHLFDGMSNQSFFNEINRQLPYTLPKADLILRKARMEFLNKTISATMDLIIEDKQNVFYQEHINWMEKIRKLSDIWDLDFGELRRHQIVELYAHGYDSYSEEHIESVDKQSLGIALLVIAGRRLTLYTKANPNVWGQVAACGPLLTDYLDFLISSDSHGPQIHTNITEISLDKLLKLTEHAFQCLSGKESKSKDLRIAGLLLDACATIKEIR